MEAQALIACATEEAPHFARGVVVVHRQAFANCVLMDMANATAALLQIE
jgi:hypothetical protein